MKITAVLGGLILVNLTLGYGQVQYDIQSEFITQSTSWFDSLNVRFVGNWPFGKISCGVATDSARQLMLLGSSGGVYILDVSDPQNPVKLSESIHTRGYVADLFYVDSIQRLFIADIKAGLEIWDITDPVSPYKLGSCDTPEYTNGIYVLDSFAYVTDNLNGLRIINVANPVDPQEVGCCGIPGYSCNVHVMGSTAYIAAAGAGLVIVDVSTPTNPQVIGSCDTMEIASDIFVMGTYAYVTNPSDQSGQDSAYLHVIDISNPAVPFEVSRVSLNDGTYGSFGHMGLYVCDTFAYLSCYPFRIINIADPFNPYIVGECNEFGNKIQISGDYAFVASCPAGLIIDISIPSAPQVVGHYEIPFMAYDVNVSAPYAYVADYDAGMYILDISSPANPFEVGDCDIGGSAWSIYIEGDYAYLPYKISGYDSMHLAVIDISEPSNPQHIGDCQADYPNMGGAWGIYVLGPYAYITIRNIWVGGQGGLWIVDVSDPSNPYGVGYFEDPQPDNHPFGVYVVDTVAYLAARDFYIINVSDPSDPQLISYCAIEGSASDVCVTGSHAYVTTNVGLFVIDVTDATYPQVLNACYINHVRRLHVYENLAYLATREGLRIIDVSSPLNLQKVGYYTSISPFTGAQSIFALYPYIFTAEKEFGLQIYENLLPCIEESKATPAERYYVSATIFSGPLLLYEGKNCRVYDITGRVVIPDRIKPGIYFLQINGKIQQKLIKIE